MGKGELTRAAIIEEAKTVASVHGLEGLSIGALAHLARMSKSGLFGHFGSKEALQRAVLESVVEDFIAAVIAPSLKQPTGVERLQALVTHWLDWSATRHASGGCPLKAASFELDDRPGPLRDYLVGQQARWLDSIARMAQRAVDDGAFRKTLDVKQFAFEFNGVGLAFSHAARLMQDPDARGRARAAFGALIDSARS